MLACWPTKGLTNLRFLSYGGSFRWWSVVSAWYFGWRIDWGAPVKPLREGRHMLNTQAIKQVLINGRRHRRACVPGAGLCAGFISAETKAMKVHWLGTRRGHRNAELDSCLPV